MAAYLLLLLLWAPAILALGFTETLNESKDLMPAFGWRFSKDRPFHYFNKTQEIHEGFVPVKSSLLPEGNGLWVLRYKDFSGSPRTFGNTQGHTGGDRSVVSFSSKALQFQSVTVKVLWYGEVQLELDTAPGLFNGKGMSLPKISLLGYNCSGPPEEQRLRWTIFNINVDPTSHITLGASIHNTESFLILDEISVRFGSEDEQLLKLMKDHGFQNNSIRTEGRTRGSLLCKTG